MVLCSDAMLLVTGEIRVTEQSCMYAALNVALHAGYRKLCPDVLSHGAHMHAALGRDNIGNRARKMLELNLSRILHTLQFYLPCQLQQR